MVDLVDTISDFTEIQQRLCSRLEAKPMHEKMEEWLQCMNAIDKHQYLPLQYKPGFIDYQTAYFEDVYPEYHDISMVLYRGGRSVGIWSICVYKKNGKLCFGTAGSSLMAPLLPMLAKAEAQRSVIEKCLTELFLILQECGGGELLCSETVLQDGSSQWIRKLMEHGARETAVKWQAFVDLSLPYEEIQSRIRRTNKYSIAKGQDTYDIEIFDENSEGLEVAFEEFHNMHRQVSGRETRNQLTWNIQKKIVAEGNDFRGRSFLIFIRDKDTKALAGSALFDTTLRTGLYCVAAYDRTRFSKPVGHIVQAIAMEKIREYGVRWYEIGERLYPGDDGSNPKLVDIGHYKEGFATHFFPRIFVVLDDKTFFENLLK